MEHFRRSLILALASYLLLASGWAQAQGVMELEAGTSQVSLSTHLQYFHDSDGDADLATVVRRARQQRFLPLPSDNAAFGFQTGAFWFHADLVNRRADEQRWLLVQEYALSDRLDVYLRYADGHVVHQAGGDHLAFAERSIRYRHPNFWLELPVGEPVDLFVRVRSQSSMQVPLTLFTPTAFTEKSRDAQLGIGLYYGILLALFIYNLVLWLTLRDASYFWYLFHVTAFGLVLFTLNGLGFEHLWPDSAWLADKSVPLSICLAQIGMQQFTRTFLGLGERWRLGDRVGLGLIAFFVIFGIAATQLPYSIATPIASLAVFVNIVWIAAATVVAVRRGYRPARIFLLAWAMFLLGTVLFVALAFGLLPKTFVTEYGVQIGSALEMLLLSVALGHRYAALRSANERIVREAKQQLEHKVQQRTTELRSALGQLEDAHTRLRETSQRDGLTGLHNRTHFHNALEALVAKARREQQPLSLLMIDLDYFKMINDHYGHLVGDECLRWAAHAIGKALRPHDALLARFGGEEFVAALPGQDLQRATGVAEQLRQQLRERTCSSGEHSIAVSASIGVHMLDTRSLDRNVEEVIDEALQAADQALYVAKAHGRDCVRAAPLPA
ncbi:sensor domain-containing diguanylate cyclase [Lysobacter sp. D1-1-M9]|uniref:sensor domain-containing diguanylate cyclase n=2 Tax=Novilysobacter TaxID=3382699 RepID=UPI002FC83174